MISVMIDMYARSRNGLGIIGRRIITKEFASRRAAFRYVRQNYYDIHINQIKTERKTK